MTNNQGEAASGGPSFVQAHSSSSSTRHNLNHNHELSHDHNHNHNHQHLHLHQRRRLHPPGADDPAPHARSPLSPPTEKLHGREVVIVQTVSVVKFIDASGTVTSVETISSSHAPLVQPTSLDIPAAVTAGLSALGNLLPSVSLSGLLPSTSDGAPSTTPTAPSGTASSQSSSYETLTSTPFSSSSAFPTLSSGIFNSSSSHIPSLFNNHTSALYLNRTRTSSSFHSTFASTISTSSHSAHLTSLTHLNLPTDVAGGQAGGANDGAGGGAATATATYVPVQPTTDSTSGGLTPETRNAVVGGVVGSVAGVALIAFVLLYLLKWKNKRGQGIMLLGDADNTTRGRAFSSGGGGPSSPRNGGGASMAERSGAFAIPAALAKLSSGGGGSKQRALAAPTPPQDQQPPPTQEKSFYRVSGRKLISVLESGGDGYSDPHDSMSSAASHSHYQYRDSEAFVDANGNPGGLQLGSPMRPVSGVPIFRDGPQRTPVHEYGPLSSPGQRPAAFNHNSSTNTLPVPVPVPDATLDGGSGGGAPRSLTSRDGSRGSASRFTEDT